MNIDELGFTQAEIRDGLLSYVAHMRDAVHAKDYDQIIDACNRTIFSSRARARAESYAPIREAAYVKTLDDCIDGYIIQSRRLLSTIRNRWVLQRLNGDIEVYARWIDDQGRTSRFDRHGLVMIEVSEKNIFDYNTLKYGLWPIRDGYVPVPDPTFFAK